MATQYRTTVGEYQWNKDHERGGGAWSADDPTPPEGEGWRLVGSAASDGTILWFWQRTTGRAA